MHFRVFGLWVAGSHTRYFPSPKGAFEKLLASFCLRQVLCAGYMALGLHISSATEINRAYSLEDACGLVVLLFEKEVKRRICSITSLIHLWLFAFLV